LVTVGHLLWILLCAMLLAMAARGPQARFVYAGF